MSARGRNDPCGCGSGKKTKRCCGVRRGPSDADLARAFVADAGRQAARELLRLPIDEIRSAFDEMLDLPDRYLSLQLRLPRILPGELETLRVAIEGEDEDEIDRMAVPALACVDTPQQRADLVRAVSDLAEDDQIGATVATAAIADLDWGSSALMRASLLRALAVSVGARPTPSGLVVVSV